MYLLFQKGCGERKLLPTLAFQPTHFDKLVIDGLMPAPRIAAGVKIWLRSELEYALLELEQDQRGTVQCQSEYTLNI